MMSEPVGAEADHHPNIVAKGLKAPAPPTHLSYSSPTVDGDAGTEVHGEGAADVDEFAGVSRT